MWQKMLKWKHYLSDILSQLQNKSIYGGGRPAGYAEIPLSRAISNLELDVGTEPLARSDR